MLLKNVIETARTESASPALFAPKKDGTIQFGVEYRKCNAVTVQDSYLFHRRINILTPCRKHSFTQHWALVGTTGN